MSKARIVRELARRATGAAKAARQTKFRTSRPQPELNMGSEMERALMPQGALEWGMELAPDLLSAGAAYYYGKDHDIGLEAAAEEMVYGLGGSAGGRAAGAALAFASRGKASPRLVRQRMQQGAGMGGFAGGFGLSMFGPRFMTDKVRKAQEEEYIQMSELQNEHPLLGSAGFSPVLQNYDALLGTFIG